MSFNFRKLYAIKQRFNSEYNGLTEVPGIYLGTREDGDITYFYVGQAKNLKNRRFDYYKIECGLSYPTRHFEASLKKHKDGEFEVLETCTVEELDRLEKYYIDKFNAMPNYITRNELIAGKDIVRSNAKRIHNVYTKYENNIKKMLKHLDIQFHNGTNDTRIGITIDPKYLKGTFYPTKLSKKAFDDLTNGLKGLIENGK